MTEGKLMSKIAWIGLGVMGFPMAGHLKMRGHHDVVVFNRTRKRADAWVATFGGTAAPTPAAAARDADFIFTCVGNDDDLREVTLGPNGAFSGLKPDAVAIDNTTASAEIARELRAATKARGAGFLDAPVSGGQSGAESGTLTVMVGGDATAGAMGSNPGELASRVAWIAGRESADSSPSPQSKSGRFVLGGGAADDLGCGEGSIWKGDGRRGRSSATSSTGMWSDRL